MPFALHLSQVECILRDFEYVAQAVPFNKPLIPYLSPFLKEVITADGMIGASYLSRTCLETVNYQAALVAGKDAGAVEDRSIWIKIGAHPVYSNMIKATLNSNTPALLSLRRNIDTWKSLPKAYRRFLWLAMSFSAKITTGISRRPIGFYSFLLDSVQERYLSLQV